MSNAFTQIHCLTPGPAVDLDAAGERYPHVLLVVDGFPKTLGGGERVVLRLASLLPAFGYKVSILTFALHPASEFQVSSAPCPVYLLPLRKTYNLDAWRSAFALRRFLRQQKVAIVQTFFESADLWAGFHAKALSPAKLVWSRRDMGILRGTKHAQAYRLLRRLPDAVLAVSEQVRQHAIAVDGIAAARVHTIHNGLDLRPCPRLTDVLMSGHATVTTVGNIRRVKGHDLFIRAAARVATKFPSIRFTIAGEVLESDYYKELERLIEELGLGGRFHFLGRITDLPLHLSRSDVFVLPSRSEGFSNALVEAMAAGLPCVATDVGGNSEAMRSEVEGLIVPPEDADALAAAMLRLLSNPTLARQMGAAAQKTAEVCFSVRAMLCKTTDIYGLLIKSNSK